MSAAAALAWKPQPVSRVLTRRSFVSDSTRLSPKNDFSLAEKLRRGDEGLRDRPGQRILPSNLPGDPSQRCGCQAEIWPGSSVAGPRDTEVANACGTLRTWDECVTSNEGGARLAEPLVSELVSKRADLKAVVGEIHRLADYFAQEARASVSIPTPTELGKRCAPPARISAARLQLFHRLLALRTAALLPEAIIALNDSRMVTFALALRGVLETAAVAAYHAPRLEVPAEATTVPVDLDTAVRAAIVSGRFDWLRFMTDHASRLQMIDAYAADPNKQVPPDQATSILTMLEHLSRRVQKAHEKGRGMVLLDYALLSDLCHPSVGSNFVFLTQVEPEMRAELTPRHETRLGFAEMLLPCVGYSPSVVVDVIAELEESIERLVKLSA